MTNAVIIDNFLEQEKLDSIKQMMVSEENDSYLPWYYKDYKVDKEDTSKYNYQLVHNFYEMWRPQSSFLEYLDPITVKIAPTAILRIKANLQIATEKIMESKMHQDTDTPGAKSAIFYVNTNNGYTLFEDGYKVPSVENRIAIFDSKLKHCATTCTDSKYRCVINMIYIP